MLVKERNKNKQPYLHFVLEGVGVSAHARVSFQLAQYDTLLEEKHLSLMPSRGRLNVWRFLPYCEDTLEGQRQPKS